MQIANIDSAPSRGSPLSRLLISGFSFLIPNP